ncbi:hypothetical protein [Bifidobacterium bohemicum]|uniref:hypothetical protein n=1 Tax=Bifidobacterium bohemicum TaxID=638617 RepID=UPI001178212C|nr:hypothetical protein [Bifidobacterium bohemicum]
MTQLNDIESYLVAFERCLKATRFSPAFPERLSVLRRTLLGDKPPFLRTVGASIPTTDLGVRFSSDYKTFYLEHVKIAHFHKIDKEVLHKYLQEASCQGIGEVMDAIILFFGDYSVVSSVINERKQEILNSGLYRDLIQSGVVLSAIGNSSSIQFLNEPRK